MSSLRGRSLEAWHLSAFKPEPAPVPALVGSESSRISRTKFYPVDGMQENRSFGCHSRFVSTTITSSAFSPLCFEFLSQRPPQLQFLWHNSRLQPFALPCSSFSVQTPTSRSARQCHCSVKSKSPPAGSTTITADRMADVYEILAERLLEAAARTEPPQK